MGKLIYYSYKKIESFNNSVITRDGITYTDDSITKADNSLINDIIIIENNITHIGSYAFKGCTNLSSIEIPTSVCFLEGMFLQLLYTCPL